MYLWLAHKRNPRFLNFNPPLWPKNKLKSPAMLVALLRARNVYADVPDVLHASAQRTSPKTIKVNSARENIVSCEAILRTRMLRSGLPKISFDDIGCSNELLYAKKMVNNMQHVVKHAMNSVSRCCRKGDWKASTDAENRDCGLVEYGAVTRGKWWSSFD
jgi:hypothetical protein